MQNFMTKVGSVALSEDWKQRTDILFTTPVRGNETGIRKLLSYPPCKCSVPPTLRKTVGQQTAYLRGVNIAVFRENILQCRQVKLSDVN
jgi:hypothetical protein